MSEQFEIRNEAAGDGDGIRSLHDAAFKQVGSAESKLVDALRKENLNVISLVAVPKPGEKSDAAILGHVLFTPVTITLDDDKKTRLDGLALAPLAVQPSVQRSGIGSALMRAGLKACRELSTAAISKSDASKASDSKSSDAKLAPIAVFLLGHVEYYPKFGFKTELAKPFRSPYSGDHFMALELIDGALKGLKGAVAYSRPFDDLS